MSEIFVNSSGDEYEYECPLDPTIRKFISEKVSQHLNQWRHYQIYLLVTNYGSFQIVSDNFDTIVKDAINSMELYFGDIVCDNQDLKEDEKQDPYKSILDSINDLEILALEKQNFYICGNYNCYPLKQNYNPDLGKLLTQFNYKNFKLYN